MTDTTTVPAPDQDAPTAAQPALEAPVNPYTAAQSTPAAIPSATRGNGFSVASLVLGIVSIPTGLAVAGIVAIVFGFLARKREPQAHTFSTWGIVLGFVGVFGWVLFAILGLLFVAPFALWGGGFGWGMGAFDVF